MNLAVHIISSISLSVFIIVFADGQCSNQLRNVENEPSYIYSPDFPVVYSQNISCSWQLVNKHENEVMMLEYESLSLESPIACNVNKLIIVDGTRTSVKCGDQKKFFMKITDETVDILFSTVKKHVETGFKIKYYSIPDYSTYCENSTVTVKASRNFSRFVTTSSRSMLMSCQWEITADLSAEVIVLEVMDPDTKSNRHWQITISEFTVPFSEPVKLSGLIDSVTRYYRSSSDKIVVKLDYTLSNEKQLQESPVIISFYSRERDDFPRDVLQVDSVPMYFYIPPYDYNKSFKDQPQIQLSSPTKCIEASLLGSNMSLLNIALTEFLYIYEGISSTSSQILNVCMIGSNSVRSRLNKMLIQQKRNTREKGTWLVVKETDSCSGSMTEIILKNTHILQTVNYPMPISGNIYCRFKVTRSSSRKDMLISIQAYPAINKTTDSSKTSLCYQGLSLNYGYYSTDLHKQFWWCMDTVKQFRMYKDFVYITLNSRTSSIKPFKLVLSLEETDNIGNCGKNILSEFVYPVNIISPYFQESFAGPIDCTWRIQSTSKYKIMKVTINKLSFQSPNICAYSKLEIGTQTTISPEVQYCSSISTPVSSEFQESRISIHFQRYAASHEGGFNATIIGYEPTKPCNGDWIYADTKPEYLVIHNKLQNWNEACKYKIASPDSNFNIIVEPIVYDLGDCRKNRIIFVDGKTPTVEQQLGTLCGSSSSDTQTRYTAESSFMHINFESTTEAKIKLKYYTEMKYARYTHLNAISSVEYFTTPNYPYSYEGFRNYTWVIDTVRGKRIKLNVIDCYLGYVDSYGRRDMVIVYDGKTKDKNKILGRIYFHSNVVLESSQSSVIVELVSVSKSTEKERGFKISYVQVDLPEEDTSSGSSSTVVIILSCIGVLVFVGMAGVLIYCFSCRRKKPASDQPTDNFPPHTNNQAYAISPHMNSSDTPTSETCFAPPPAYELDRFIPDVPPPSYEESAKYEIKSPPTSDATV